MRRKKKDTGLSVAGARREYELGQHKWPCYRGLFVLFFYCSCLGFVFLWKSLKKKNIRDVFGSFLYLTDGLYDEEITQVLYFSDTQQ